MATRGTKWLIDQSTDLVPSLLRLALAEVRDGSPPAVVVSEPLVVSESLVVSPIVVPFEEPLVSPFAEPLVFRQEATR
jgi:hypothetical protein